MVFKAICRTSSVTRGICSCEAPQARPSFRTLRPMRPLALSPVGTTVGSLASAGAKALSRSTAGSGSTGASDSSSVSQQVRCVLRVFVHRDVLLLGVHRHQLRGHGLDSFGLPEEIVVLVFRTHTWLQRKLFIRSQTRHTNNISTFSLRNYQISFFLFLFCLPVRSQGVWASLCRAPVDEPGFPPTDAKDHTLCVVRALMPTSAALPPHVCHRQETGLSPLARTCSKTWVFLQRLHI